MTRLIVHSAIHFDNQPSFGAIEVDDEAVNWMLAAETESADLPAPKSPPQDVFRWRRVSAHETGAFLDVLINGAVGMRMRPGVDFMGLLLSIHSPQSNPFPGPSRHLYGEHPKALGKGV